MKGLEPGPVVFIDNAPLVYSIFVSFFIANLMLLPIGYLAIKVSKQMLRISSETLMPLVLVFCTVGSFAINNSLVGVIVMMVLGFVSFIMQENGFPVAPVILGMVMGPLLEENFMQAMICSNGNLLAFFSRPIAAGLGTVTILVWLSPVFRLFLRKMKANGPDRTEDNQTPHPSCMS